MFTAAGYRVTVISPQTLAWSWHEALENVCVDRYPRVLAANGFPSYLDEYGYSILHDNDACHLPAHPRAWMS